MNIDSPNDSFDQNEITEILLSVCSQKGKPRKLTVTGYTMELDNIRRRRFQNSLICIGFEELSQCDKRLESLTVPLVVNPRTAVWNFKTQPFHLDQRNITVPFSFMSINFFA